MTALITALAGLCGVAVGAILIMFWTKR